MRGHAPPRGGTGWRSGAVCQGRRGLREKDRDIGGRRPVLGQAGVLGSGPEKVHGFLRYGQAAP